jgi:hypothetical protein
MELAQGRIQLRALAETALNFQFLLLGNKLVSLFVRFSDSTK